MRTLSMAAALPLAFCAATVTAQPALDDDDDRTLYSLGQVLGSNIQTFELSAEELEIVAAGIEDAVLGRPSRVDVEAFMPSLQALARERAAATVERERAAAGPFLQQMANEPGAERTASGLIFIPIEAGSGASPTDVSLVRVHYHGTLRDGTVFDSSVDRGEPIVLSLEGVIPCWTEGLQKMRVGGKAKLVCPSDIAYGDQGQGPIPAGATLVFEVELLDIE